ncbi:putative ATP synthase subunit f [Blattella germanica]|nr:putative ATP synthase subunit f [Blattella germanica]
MAFGDYPADYNPKVHGPFDPARYYGTPDTPLSQVKLGELGSWLGRRNKNPKAMVAAVSRCKFHLKNPGGGGNISMCSQSELESLLSSKSWLEQWDSSTSLTMEN